MPFYGLGRRLKYSMANGALVSVAALVPPKHKVVIVDENVEPIDFESLRNFDVVGVTGMVVQANRMYEILRRLRGLPGTIVVGGPLVTVNEAAFEDLCDVRFIGEAEVTWPRFLNSVASGSPYESRYEQDQKTDMTTVPVPRFDLLKRGRYGTAPVQFSRGCPFLCEFCDIITIFGRRPRTKHADQVLAELDAVVAQGFRGCFLVDDNFIGNKVEARRLLTRIIEWQQIRGFPLEFVTEASINLANDPELMDLMVRANLRRVFVGIESPRAESLTETRKHQNVHGDSLLAKVARLRDAGLIVSGGFIVGFDHDDEHIFDEQFDFIQASGIANLSISLLTPLPTTPLYDRLQAEGRLDFTDPELIYHPKQMTRAQLKTGFRRLLTRVFDVDAYFARVFEGGAAPSSRATPTVRPSLKLRVLLSGVWTARALWLAWTMARQRQLVRHLRALRGVLRQNSARGDRAFNFGEMVNHWITYWHFASVTRQISGTQFGNVTSASIARASTSTNPSPADKTETSSRRGDSRKRTVETCFALVMRTIPRAYRFGVAWYAAHAVLPFLRLTAAYRTQKKIGFDSPHEIALHFVLNALTRHGTKFDPLISIEGYEEFERAHSAGRGVLVVGPHAALTLLMIRVFHDRGLDPIVITPDARMRIGGTDVMARTVQPSRTFLVKARNRLRQGELVCAMPDRAEHHGKRTIEFNTATGSVIVAPALMELAVRCGAEIIFAQVHADRRGLVGVLASPSATPAAPETITDDFIAFVRANPALAAA